MKFSRIGLLMLGLIILFPVLCEAQAATTLTQKIRDWVADMKPVVNAVIALVALAGGLGAYLKMQSDDGNNGKKAVTSFIGALIFAALMFIIIDVFIPKV